jgi:DNA-binding NarL/FixJ family response regulator
MITLLIVDDHATVRAGLRNLLETNADMTVIAEAADGAESIDLVNRHRPQVVLMDLSMPHMNGIEATREILAQKPDSRIIALTSFADQERVTAMLDAGACGYLLKEDEPEDLVKGIRAAADGQAPLAPRAAAALLRSRSARTAHGSLTDRERQVLRLLASGLTNAGIAQALNVRVGTVKAHLTRIYEALGVTDRTSAALRAKELHLHTANPR